jgi:hypothetical protein
MQTLEKTEAPAGGKSPRGAQSDRAEGNGPANISQLGYRDLLMTITIAIQHLEKRALRLRLS